MKFRHTIIYVADVPKTLAWYEKTFGFAIRFQAEGHYGELETGETLLSFASHDMGKANLPGGYAPVDGKTMLGIEIALITDDVKAALDRALKAGATLISKPEEKPWGQMVAYCRAPEGTVIEFGTPMSE